MNYAKEVREFVITNYLFGDASALDDDRSFLESGIIDSTGMLEMIMFLEKTYDISVKPEEMVPGNLDSVNRLAEFVGKKKVKATS